MSKMFFPKGLKAGDPVNKDGFIQGILAMAKALENMSVMNGRVDWANGEPKIIVLKVAKNENETTES